MAAAEASLKKLIWRSPALISLILIAVTITVPTAADSYFTGGGEEPVDYYAGADVSHHVTTSDGADTSADRSYDDTTEGKK